ncbi:HlyD family secretion protein [Synechococcus sp. MIT S9509]
MDGRIKRYAGAGLVLLAVVSIYTHMTRKKSIEAYVATDMVTIQSPIDGVVKNSDIDGGKPFKKGTLLVSISASRLDAQFLDQADNRLREFVLKLDNFNQQIGSVILNLERQLNISIRNETIKSIEASETYNLAKEVTDMHDYLHSEGAIKTENLLNAKIDLAKARAEKEKADNKLIALRQDIILLSEIKAETEERKLHFKNMRRYVSNNNTIDHNQKTSSISLKKLVNQHFNPVAMNYKFSSDFNSLAGELYELLSKHDSLHDELKDAYRKSEVSNQRKSFNYAPQFNGILLMKAISTGDEVSESQPLLTLLNCDRRRIEALFNTSRVKNSKVSDEVKINWVNRNKYSLGTIKSIIGEQSTAGIRSAGNVVFQTAAVDRTRVIIDLKRETMNAFFAEECNIGEKVVVEL